MNVSVFGLGYVGCVSAACFAKAGHRVIGVDVNEAKVRMVNDGESTIVEEGIADLVRNVVTSGHLRGTTDVEEATRESEISLICVGTPSSPNGSIDLSYVQKVCGEIGAALRNVQQHHLVVVRSTVMPGTIETLVVPTLEAASGKRRGDGFDVCSNPEFLREGSSVKDFFNPPYTLVGAASADVAAPLRDLYAFVDAPFHVCPIRAAEMVKYASNCFHAVKITFSNEIGNVAKALGIDGHVVMQLVSADTKLNVSPAYLKPGFAFGGSCLPKDLRALAHRAKQLDVETPLLVATQESNRLQVERAINMVLATGHNRVGVLGLSFKEGTDDLRESPVVAVVERLIGKGLHLAIYDRNVSQGGLLGANKSFIERQIPHIWSLMRDSMAEVIDVSETVLLANADEEFRGVASQIRPGQAIVDLARVFPKRISDSVDYRGICW